MGKKYKDRNGQEWEIIYISDKEIMYPVVAMYTHDSEYDLIEEVQ
jgi:hypothetical protein